MKNFFETKTYTKILILLGTLLIIWIIFAAGILVGYHEATFSYNWNANYQQGMGTPDSPFAPFMHDADDVNPHGSIGQIVSIRLPILMIKGQDTAEQMVVIGSSTVIRLFHEIASSSAIKAGQYAIAIGEPNDKGQIQASFIRIVPPPPNVATTTDTATSTQ